MEKNMIYRKECQHLGHQESDWKL